MNAVDTRYLNGIRFFLAVWVAVGHFYKYNGGVDLIYIPILSQLVLANGAAVDGFMIITGFLMMYHYILKEKTELPASRNTIKKFYLRRFFRIYPLYALAMLIAYLFYDTIYIQVYENTKYFTGKLGEVGFSYTSEAIPNLFDLFAHMTFLHGFIPVINTSILGPAWSLSLEAQFYLLFPLIFIAFFKNESKVNNSIIYLSVASVIIGFLTPKLLGEWDSPGMLTNFVAPSLLIYKIQFFYLGMLMGAVVLNRAKMLHLVLLLVIMLPFQTKVSTAVLILIVSLMFTDSYKGLLNKNIYKWVVAFKNALSKNVFSYLGDLSYSIYIIHMIVMTYVVKVIIIVSPFKPLVTFIFALIAFLFVTIGISHFLFKYLEKPLTKFGKTIVDRGRVLKVKPLLALKNKS